MKATSALLSLSLSLPIVGQVYTIPEGYTKIDIAEAASPTQPTLTAISATLLNDLDHSSAITINSDFAGDPTNTQTVAVSGVTWAADEWTANPHIAYIAVADDLNNADGIAPAEEAFFITANTTGGGLTLSTSFDLTDKFPATTTIKIRRANTVSSILNALSTGSATFQSADRVFVWVGTTWKSLRLFNGVWRDADTFADVNNMVIFPEEGIFVQRTGAGAMSLTIFGEVPSAPQIASIEASGFLSSRYPVGTTLADLGLQDSNWQSADRVYIWNGSTWLSNRFFNGEWRDADTFAPTDNAVIDSNTAVFVSRAAELVGAGGGVTTPLPPNYNID